MRNGPVEHVDFEAHHKHHYHLQPSLQIISGGGDCTRRCGIACSASEQQYRRRRHHERSGRMCLPSPPPSLSQSSPLQYAAPPSTVTRYRHRRLKFFSSFSSSLFPDFGLYNCRRSASICASCFAQLSSRFKGCDTAMQLEKEHS